MSTSRSTGRTARTRSWRAPGRRPPAAVATPRTAWPTASGVASASTSCSVRAWTPSPAGLPWPPGCGSSKSIIRRRRNGSVGSSGGGAAGSGQRPDREAAGSGRPDREAAGSGRPDPETAGRVTFVPVDFARDSLRDRLGQAGFDFARAAFVSWLGVTMYLEPSAIEQTLSVAGGFAAGSEIVVDYMLPAGLRDEAGDYYAEQVGPASAERGEPWRSMFAPDDMAARLQRHGFGPVRHVRQQDMIPAAAWDRTDSLRPTCPGSRMRCSPPGDRAWCSPPGDRAWCSPPGDRAWCSPPGDRACGALRLVKDQVCPADPFAEPSGGKQSYRGVRCAAPGAAEPS